MERRKSKGSCNDELALVKAAAWAWFQHGSGTDVKPVMPEFDVRRTCHAPYKPSRYKLEAMIISNINKQGMEFEGLKSPSVVESNSDHSLLDTYEIECISRKLDQLIESSGDKGELSKGFLAGDVLGRNKAKPGGRGSNPDLECGDKCSLPLKLQAPNLVEDNRRQGRSESLMDGKTNGRKNKNKNFTGFWHRHAAICGRSDDVLNTKPFVVSRHRPREKGVYAPVVKMANCRPRVTQAL
ncbi:uncharacterized protein Pyn_31634 [Prunus yedoensis var. nudiflora]|uniref:Uncharacterized protein n=1 Tax=Prunus yedoensis var. nudiflora TaxID=2094558 RepID=A0A314V3Z5_PRUYE|nr:uncharacterized protein Pyn_31634 [Prunus yedoensis var. nudiflora]